MLAAPIKDPIKVRAGQIGAQTRWGPDRRVIRLHDLTPEQRRLVVALVEAAKAEKAAPDTLNEEAARANATPRAATPAVIDADRQNHSAPRSHRRAERHRAA